MRRLCLLFALVGLMSAILAGAGGAADARALRRKVKGKTRAHPAAATAVHAPTRRKRAARTQDAESAGTPTSPDVVPRRLMIVGFDGRGAQVARAAAADALRTIASVRVLPLAPAEAMRLGTAYGAEKTVGLAQHLNLTAVLFGKITQARRDVRLSMQLANGEDGRVIGEMNFQARSVGALRTKVRAQLWSKLSPLIDRAASPGPPATIVSEGELPIDRPRELPAEPPVPEAEPPAKPPGAVAPLAAESDDEEAPAPAGTGAGGGKPRPHAGGPTGVGAAEHEIEAVVEDRPATAPQRCPVAELSPGAGIMARRYNYRAEQIGALRGYSLYRAPVGRIDGTLYPFSGGGCRVGNGVGLRGSYEIMGPVTSQVGGRHLGTQASAYELDLVLRIVSGRLTVQPALGFLARQYHVDGQVVPSADYRAVGGGVDVALRGRILGFGIGAAGWGILHVGELESAAWFPRQSHFGVTARAQASVAVSPWIDIVAGATAQYETFTFTVDQGAANPNGIAGGAYDFYVQGTAGVRFRLGLTTAPRPRP